jgi:hypothetical protein
MSGAIAGLPGKLPAVSESFCKLDVAGGNVVAGSKNAGVAKWQTHLV